MGLKWPEYIVGFQEPESSRRAEPTSLTEVRAKLYPAQTKQAVPSGPMDRSAENPLSFSSRHLEHGLGWTPNSGAPNCLELRAVGFLAGGKDLQIEGQLPHFFIAAVACGFADRTHRRKGQLT